MAGDVLLLGAYMKRRTFVSGSGLGIPAAPLVVDAQQSGTVGVLLASSAPGAGFGIAWKGAG
jgi:hypothetical protein